MLKIKKDIVKTFFIKNVLTMFKGTIISQIIAIIGAVFIAKLYGEEAYGFFGVFISISSFFSIVTTLQLENCIITSKDEKESINWYNFLFLLVLTILVLFTIIVLFSLSFIEYKTSYKNILPFTILGTLLLSFNLLNINLFTFKKEFSIISNSKILFTICNVTLQFFLYSKYNSLGLIIGFLISQLLLFLYYTSRNKKNTFKLNFNEIKKGIRTNSSIIKFLLPSNITNSLANHLMPILILSFFGAKEAGVYFFSIKIIGTPLTLISSSISQVFFKKSSELLSKSKNELLKLTKKIVKTNLLLMFVLLVIINTIGIYILEIYFDKKWENLRLYTLILSILFFSRAAFNPISSLIIVLNKNQIGLLFNLYLFTINLIAVYIGYLYEKIVYTISILSFFGGIGYIVLLLYFITYLKNISQNNV